MSNGIVVLSGKEEYVNGVKEYLEKLCLSNICVVEANHAIGNPGIIERLELECEQKKNIIIVGGSRRERDFLEIVSWSSEFLNKGRVFWAEDLRCIKNLKSFIH